MLNQTLYMSTTENTSGDTLSAPVSSTNNTDRHGISEILLEVPLNTITTQFSIE